MDTAEIKHMVRARYGGIANGSQPDSSCCAAPTSDISLRMGYSADELAAVPAGANLGLGCSNPQAIAAIRPGETVVHLGSGAGFGCFLAARQVGPTGHVIGVDMTHEMLARRVTMPPQWARSTSSFAWARSSTSQSPTTAPT